MLTPASSIPRSVIGRATGRTGALVGALIVLVLVLTGCRGGTADQPTAHSSAPTPTATPTAMPAASIKPMTQPTKPYPLPKLPAKPATADELTAIGYGVERIVWASAGTVDPRTSAACTTTNATLVVDKATLKFDCVVTASGVRTTFAISSTTGPKNINWDFKVARLPVTEAKVEYEASRQSFKPARVTCDVHGTELVPLGDPNAISCWVAQTDNTSIAYVGGLDDSGVITFTLAAVPTFTPTPTPTVTPTVTAMPTGSSSPSPTPSTR